MTANPQMHPLRCETCNNTDCPFGFEEKYIVRLIPNIMRRVGCASHSSANTSEKVLDELEKWLKIETIRDSNVLAVEEKIKQLERG